MGTPFKMKGSPFQRNFGIGSPVKQAPDKKKFIEDHVNPDVNLTKKQTGPVEDGSGGANFTNNKKNDVVTNPKKKVYKPKTNSTKERDFDKSKKDKFTKNIGRPVPELVSLANDNTTVVEKQEKRKTLGTFTPKRETSWWKGEEGWIPDELQPNVNRPKVSDKKVKAVNIGASR